MDRQLAEIGMSEYMQNDLKTEIKRHAKNAARYLAEGIDCMKLCRTMTHQPSRKTLYEVVVKYRLMYLSENRELTRCINELAAS